MFFDSPQTLAAVSATTTAATVSTIEASNVVGLMIQPTNGTIYVGGSGVTSSTGIQVDQGQVFTVATKTPKAWYVITASGTADVRVSAFRGFR